MFVIGEGSRETEIIKHQARQQVSNGRRLGMAALIRHVPTPGRFPTCLFVRDCGAGWASKMNDFELIEADLTAPFFEIGSGIIERIAELDQHV